MLRISILAWAIPLIAAGGLAGGQFTPAAQPCIQLSHQSVRIARGAWQSQQHVSFTTDPGKATVRVQIVDDPARADFAVVDGAEPAELDTADGAGCTAGDNVPQLRYVLSRADVSASAGYPTIVTGDFNFDATTLLRDKSWADAVMDKGGTFHNFHGGRGARLDFIGLKNLSSVSSGVDTRRDPTRSPTVYPSDHYPVWAVLE